MERFSSFAALGPWTPPLNPASQDAADEGIGSSHSGRRVRSRSPSPESQPRSSSFLAQNAQGLPSPPPLTTPPGSPLLLRQREVESASHKEGPARKAAKKAASQQQPGPQAGLGLVFAPARVDGKSKTAARREAAPSAALHQAPPPGGTFYVTAQELATMSTSSSRPLVVRGSSSDGRFLVAYADPVAQPQGPGQQAPAEPRLAALDQALAPQVPQPAVNPQEAQELAPPAQAFDPVNSRLAKTLRSRLRKALAAGTDAKAIYRDLLRPAAGHWAELKDKRQAFTPEFLVAVLLVLPSLANDEERTVLGEAVGALRVPARTLRGTGTLGRAARAVIGQALAHEAVQARVPLDTLMVFLTGANAGGARQWNHFNEEARAQTGQRGELGASRNQFTASAVVCGIAQALAGRLARQAQEAAPAQLDAVLATATRLGSLLGAGLVRGTIRQATLEAVASVVDGTSLPPATKTQLKDHFSTAYTLPAAESGDELSDDAAS